jgi:uncharacterized protein
MSRTKVTFLLIALSLAPGCKPSPQSNGNNQANANRQVANADGRDEHGATELKRAVDKDDAFEVRRLVESGADVNAATPEGVTPLMNASGFGNKEIVQLLISKGAQVNAKTKSSYTALMSAALSGQREIIQILLDAGADPNIQDTVTKKTAMDIAEEKGHKDIVEILRRRGGKKGSAK